jgi:two-component system cell cycle response regulator DivK
MKKVLIVEDNEANLKLVREVLIYIGYKSIEAKNGYEGIELAEKEKPDLILMDIQMPKMNGVEAIKKIRKITELKNIPILALTAFAMKGDRERFLSEGFNDYIQKPFRIDELIEKIQKYLNVFEPNMEKDIRNEKSQNFNS